jgi:hypothetical protein
MLKIEYKAGDYLQCDYGKWININQIIQIESYYDYNAVRGTAKPAPKQTRLYTPTECIILDIEPKEFINLINLRKTQEKAQYYQAIENMYSDIVKFTTDNYKTNKIKKWK